eukprot:190878-Rhodomonas_salina.1
MACTGTCAVASQRPSLSQARALLQSCCASASGLLAVVASLQSSQPVEPLQVRLVDVPVSSLQTPSM